MRLARTCTTRRFRRSMTIRTACSASFGKRWSGWAGAYRNRRRRSAKKRRGQAPSSAAEVHDGAPHVSDRQRIALNTVIVWCEKRLAAGQDAGRAADPKRPKKGEKKRRRIATRDPVPLTERQLE